MEREWVVPPIKGAFVSLGSCSSVCVSNELPGDAEASKTLTLRFVRTVSVPTDLTARNL